MQVDLVPDVQPGRVRSVVVTLGAAEVVTAITLPDDCRGFRLLPTGQRVRFALNGAPAAVQATATGAQVAATAFGLGGVAVADQWETRLIGYNGHARTLHLASSVAATMVVVEVF